MNPIKTAAVGLATVAASLLLAPNAAATPGTCTITFQPFDGRSYAAAAVVDGQVEHIITRQSGVLDNGPVSVTYTTPSGIVGDLTGVTEVWWAARNPAKQDTAADFYDVMHVRPDCTFVEAYHAIPGKQDSVVIRTATYPTPTLPIETTTSTTALPTTTSTAPATTTTAAPEPSTTTAPPPIETVRTTPTIPPTTAPEVTTTIAVPVVDVPLTPAPTTTAPAPNVPSSSVVDLYTATSVERAAVTGSLPVTGTAWLIPLAGIGALALLIGGFIATLTPARRRLARENAR